jgi:hypothetical protein
MHEEGKERDEADNRLINQNWLPGENGKAPTWERVQVAILMDIRDELQRLNKYNEVKCRKRGGP